MCRFSQRIFQDHEVGLDLFVPGRHLRELHVTACILFEEGIGKHGHEQHGHRQGNQQGRNNGDANVFPKQLD